MKHLVRWLAGLLLLLVLLLTGPALLAMSGSIPMGGSWQGADRSSAGLAPDPALTHEAVVQVYGARAFKWRGVFAAHTWIAAKDEGAAQYTLYQVTRWRGMQASPGVADMHWFGNRPHVLGELRGTEASRAIERIEALVDDYPYRDLYRAWPGPNSNTFVAWITRQVPELQARLPSIALGKDYLSGAGVAAAPSGTGLQVSAYGLLGVLVASREGLEINLLGLVLGFDPRRPGIKLPGIGEVGFGRDTHNPSPEDQG